MLFLREIFSVVLLLTPVEGETGHPPDNDVNPVFANCERPERSGDERSGGETLNVNVWTLTFFMPSACTRRTPRPETWVRAPVLDPIVGKDQTAEVSTLIKDVLRLITGYIGVESGARSEVQTMTMVIGLRG